jgi:UDP-N-acetylmuramoyl-L-alanyl-D-glutamate--2,6-diaminopimelate ligase
VLEARFAGRSSRFRYPLLGEPNVENAAVALGMAVLAGVAAPDAAAYLETVPAPPGRMDHIGGRPDVIVDVAYTPVGVARVLRGVRPLVRGRLVCVLGACGDDDPAACAALGSAASRNADVVIVTTDNPGAQDPVVLASQVLGGADGPAEVFEEIDRLQALARAVLGTHRDDVILVLGRGTDTHVEVAGVWLPFDDVEVCRRLLQQRQGD